jgi:AraC-like DNA-binding protein
MPKGKLCPKSRYIPCEWNHNKNTTQQSTCHNTVISRLQHRVCLIINWKPVPKCSLQYITRMTYKIPTVLYRKSKQLLGIFPREQLNRNRIGHNEEQTQTTDP